jgi:hypothetical protein
MLFAGDQSNGRRKKELIQLKFFAAAPIQSQPIFASGGYVIHDAARLATRVVPK